MIDYVKTVKEFAAIRRGEHPGWKGDRIANGEAFAHQLGLYLPLEDTTAFVQSLHDAEDQYSKLSGLPSRSLQILASEIKRGQKARAADPAATTVDAAYAAAGGKPGPWNFDVRRPA